MKPKEIRIALGESVGYFWDTDFFKLLLLAYIANNWLIQVYQQHSLSKIVNEKQSPNSIESDNKGGEINVRR